MKVACVTDNGTTISEHFGRATYYAVLTIENGQIANHELRPKAGHGQFQSQEHVCGGEHQHHGMDAGSHDRHVQMASGVSDCQAVLSRGMGRGAYESLRRLGIDAVVTDMGDIDLAAKAYAAGTLVNHMELLH